jgi:hypothetical protein
MVFVGSQSINLLVRGEWQRRSSVRCLEEEEGLRRITSPLEDTTVAMHALSASLAGKPYLLRTARCPSTAA